MSVESYLYAIGGLGMYLLALRLLTRGFDRTIAYRLRAMLRLRARSLGFMAGAGALTTAFVQASSITVVMTMGFLQTGWIRFEQAYFAMLGAIVGTSVKVWVGAGWFKHGGLLLAGLGSLAMVFARGRTRRALLEAVVAIGLAFTGLEFLSDGMLHLVGRSDVLRWLNGGGPLRLEGEIAAVAVGLVLSAIVQSPGTVVFLAVDLATRGVINVPAGAAIVLGASLGTTLTPFLASIEYDLTVRRLALAHVLVQALAVLVGAVLFPWVLALCLFPVHALFGRVSSGVEIASFQTVFSLATALGAWALATPIQVLVRWMARGDSREDFIFSNPVVRRMVSGTPEVALHEARGLVRDLLQMSRDVLYPCVDALAGKPEALLAQKHAAQDHLFEQLRESVLELLFAVGRRARTPTVQAEVGRLLHLVGQCSTIHAASRRLSEHLVAGFILEEDAVPPALTQAFGELRGAIDEIWLDLLFPRQRGGGLDDEALSFYRIDALRVGDLHDTPRALTNAHWLQEAVESLRHAVTLLVAMRGHVQQDSSANLSIASEVLPLSLVGEGSPSLINDAAVDDAAVDDAAVDDAAVDDAAVDDAAVDHAVVDDAAVDGTVRSAEV